MRYLHSTIKFVIRDSHFDLYYLYSSTNTNEFDLKVFKKEYNDFNDAWIDFKNTYVSYMGKRLDRKMQNQLGEKLQLVKEKNQTLISEVRKKY